MAVRTGSPRRTCHASLFEEGHSGPFAVRHSSSARRNWYVAQQHGSRREPARVRANINRLDRSRDFASRSHCRFRKRAPLRGAQGSGQVIPARAGMTDAKVRDFHNSLERSRRSLRDRAVASFSLRIAERGWRSGRETKSPDGPASRTEPTSLPNRCERDTNASLVRRDCVASRHAWWRLAVRTGLEPATSAVTGRCSNQIELPDHRWQAGFIWARGMGRQAAVLHRMQHRLYSSSDRGWMDMKMLSAPVFRVPGSVP